MAIARIDLDLGQDFRQRLKSQIKNEMSTDINTMSTNFGQRIKTMDNENQNKINQAIDDLKENLIKQIAPVVVGSQSAITSNGYYLIGDENNVDYGKLFIKYNGRNVCVGNVVSLPNERLTELEQKVNNHMHLIQVVEGLHEDENGNLTLSYSYIAPITDMKANYEDNNSALQITFKTY